jgi:hypothetical protein
MHYCKAGGLCIALLMLLIQVIGRGLDITGAFWLAAWADEELIRRSHRIRDNLLRCHIRSVWNVGHYGSGRT